MGQTLKTCWSLQIFVSLLLRFTYGIVRSSALFSFARGIDASGETPCAPGSRYVMIKNIFFFFVVDSSSHHQQQWWWW